jgi:hypothetical protein
MLKWRLSEIVRLKGNTRGSSQSLGHGVMKFFPIYTLLSTDNSRSVSVLHQWNAYHAMLSGPTGPPARRFQPTTPPKLPPDADTLPRHSLPSRGVKAYCVDLDVSPKL